MPRLDISNQRFGRLVALYHTEKRDSNRGVIWECLCDCGNRHSASASSLRHGLSSCGCLQREAVSKSGKASAKNLTGRRFGRLVALHTNVARVSNQIHWLCICDCGREASVRTAHLLSGATTSCGCYHQEISKTVNTTHGLSKEEYYRPFVNRRRTEIKTMFDSSWTLEMELKLKEFFTACVLCGDTDNLSVDHLLPLSLGYGLSTDNVVILCGSCNSKKTDKYITDLPSETRRKLIDASCAFQDHLEQQMYIGDAL